MRNRLKNVVWFRLISTHLVCYSIFLFPCALQRTLQSADPSKSDIEFFEKQIRPLLAKHCYSCHSAQAKKLQAGLYLDRRSGLLQGGDSGSSIIPGKPDESLLIQAVNYDSFEMPPAGKLDQKQINLLEKWVKMGAPWPKESTPERNAPAKTDFNLQERKQRHWAWQPITNPDLPEIDDANWPQQDLDRFVLAGLEANQLKPARKADRSSLIRRVYFDLIGLPPSPAELHAYLADRSSNAFEKVVDHLLASPHFGERWGRHWLDLVRYAESRGHEFDDDARNAFQYRDYVIRALNADVPYDQFVREHIAGDLLTEPRMHPVKLFNESILGTGFWFLGEWVHSPVDIRKEETDRIDNMIDVMSKTFLGLTVSCARCHDHKFDAISTKDYYSFAGFLQSSDYRQVRFETLEHNRAIHRQLQKIDKTYRNRIADPIQQAGMKTPELPQLDPDIAQYIVFDYNALKPEEFLQNGFLFRQQHVGTPVLSIESDQPALRLAAQSAAVSDWFWNGLKSTSEKGVHNRGQLSKIPRSGRTLRTPTFEVTHGNIACRLTGAGHVVACVDSHRLVAGPLHRETIRQVKPDDDGVVLNLARYLGHRIHLEFTPAPNTVMTISRVLMGASTAILKKLKRYEQNLAENIKEYQQQAFAVVPRQIIVDWARERARLQKQVQLNSHIAMAMLDGTGEDEHVLIRGNHENRGETAPRRFLEAIAGDSPMHIPRGSGRLQLAAAINHSDNPLTHRVIVNRVWHHLMGRGIVPTVDDFGVLGERPTHPELLDHLVNWFRFHDQSLKSLIKHIVSSQSYQMSSQIDNRAQLHDPKNWLWHHMPRKRLQGEVLRDTLLTLSGSLDPQMYGEPVPVHLTDFMDGRGRPSHSGPLDGNGRRTIYIAVRRNFISPLMLAFDTPTPFSTMGKRNVTNVPAQALILMNSPFVKSQAKLWAEKTIASEPDDIQKRIEYMYESAFAREPGEQEYQLALQYVSQLASEQNTEINNAAIWAEFAHVLFNVKEFIYLR